jgi:hypothetical protein
LLSPSLQVKQFHGQGKQHGELDGAPRDVFVDAVGLQHEADQDEEASAPKSLAWGFGE